MSRSGGRLFAAAITLFLLVSPRLIAQVEECDDCPDPDEASNDRNLNFGISGAAAGIPPLGLCPARVLGPRVPERLAGLALSWPVALGGAPAGAVSQGFGEYNRERACRFHTGTDIVSPAGSLAVAAAAGEVARIQLDDQGCPAPSACADHGYGNAVVVYHGVFQGAAVYTQYAHLLSVEPDLLAACRPSSASSATNLVCSTRRAVAAGEPLGVVGASEFGRPPNGAAPRLLFELKTFETLGTAKGEFRETTDDPALSGYLDPLLALHDVRLPASVPTVRLSGSDRNGFVGPGENAAGAYRVFTAALRTDIDYQAVASAPATPSCAAGWVLVKTLIAEPWIRDEGSPDKEDALSQAWVCGDALVSPPPVF